MGLVLSLEQGLPMQAVQAYSRQAQGGSSFMVGGV
jgi:hypothetical protein